MADVNSQTLSLYRGEDRTIAFTAVTSTDITSWAIAFTISLYPGSTPLLTLTTAGGAITGLTSAGALNVALTRAQTSALTLDEYHWDLWRTDSGTSDRKAGGVLLVNTPIRLPA